MKRYILIHYGEIGLKGENLQYFVKKLRNYIKIKLAKKFRDNFSLHYMLGRFLLSLPDDFDESKIANVLWKIPGIRNFKFVFAGSLDLTILEKEILLNLSDEFSQIQNLSFCVRAKRSMDIGVSSVEAEKRIGAFLLENRSNLKVNLSNPEYTVDIEFFNNQGFFSFKKYQGMGGLPSGSQGKLVSLVSSGFDSPVAAFQMMRRGAKVIFVNFHSYPFSDMDEINQVKELCGILAEYQPETKLFLVPFGDIQKKIATNLEVPAKYRVILYRRIMLKIAQEIAKRNKAKGLITGDNYGQVASQTPDNIFTIDEAVDFPVYRPLISFDKEDIIKISEKIGTYDISKLPCQDSCSMFTPKHPELNGNPFEARKYEEQFPVDMWIKEALLKSEIILF